ncbi:MAG TPA: hypothetical protein VHI99_20100 [Vicinamibacterales bacterium]|jgi:hypothetical protein|nr:hypothetical protein [Vicinamibacterales bacterium]
MAKKPLKAGTAEAIDFEVSPRLPLLAKVRAFTRGLDSPIVRPLRIYTLDPSVSDRSGGIATVQIPYETLMPGPIGSLFDVRIDKVPEPLTAAVLNLDDANLLIGGGLPPSPSNGRFHLQMVYAVSCLTYAAFRRALGRDIGWAVPAAEDGSLRLILRPFGFRGRNAGYNRETGDVSFGYFNATSDPAGFIVRNGLICTSLSHDIIAHEVSHALLDGLRSSFLHPTNVDVPAFHEALADLVALLLHFTYPEVVEQAIRDSRGAITRGSLLSDLAREFGYARGKKGKGSALRSGVDVQGIKAFDSDVAAARDGAPLRYDPSLEPHQLGTVLVSAVFEAFATIVKRKSERFFRIAGIDPGSVGEAPISDALVKAIAQEASEVAGQFLNICIRAVDYCPPADMEMGEYLRAMITADGDVERTDKYGFREALMRSFRRRLVFPDHVKFMTEESVRWDSIGDRLRIPGLAFSELHFAGEPGQPADAKELDRRARALGRFVTNPKHAGVFHLVAPSGKLPKGVTYASPPTMESVRVTRRAAPDGRILFDLVAEITQTCTVQQGGDLFEMNGGATVVIDPEGEVRYAIYKRFTSEDRRNRQRAAMRGPLKDFWKRSGRRFTERKDVLRRVHQMAGDEPI